MIMKKNSVFMDLAVYSTIAMAVKDGKWGK